MAAYLKERVEQAAELWWRYERHLIVVGLATGFVFDLIIAERPDSVFNNVWLLSYLVLAAALILVLNVRETRRASEEHQAHPLLLLFGLQVCFGALASNLLVLYLHSGTLAGSAIFLGLMTALLVGNEFLRGRYGQLRLNVAVYYFLLLSYCVLAVPTFFLHSIGPVPFLISGAVSLGIIALFLFILDLAVYRGDKRAKLRQVFGIVSVIFLFYASLYFLNVIPPVPLALKDIGIYHSLLRHSSGSYVAMYEQEPWYKFWLTTSDTFTLTNARTAFCFSSVFAPTQLSAPIVHRWEQYNEAAGRWESRSRVEFSISGGRDEGYRGFSQKSALEPGRWRCSVETQAGALVGRLGFEVVEGAAPELVQIAL
jgi:hypothetical protein